MVDCSRQAAETLRPQINTPRTTDPPTEPGLERSEPSPAARTERAHLPRPSGYSSTQSGRARRKNRGLKACSPRTEGVCGKVSPSLSFVRRAFEPVRAPSLNGSRNFGLETGGKERAEFLCEAGHKTSVPGPENRKPKPLPVHPHLSRGLVSTRTEEELHCCLLRLLRGVIAYRGPETVSSLGKARNCHLSHITHRSAEEPQTRASSG